MLTIQEIRVAAAEKLAEIKKIELLADTEKRDLNDDEIERIKVLYAENTKLDERATLMQNIEDANAKDEERNKSAVPPPNTPITQPEGGLDERLFPTLGHMADAVRNAKINPTNTDQRLRDWPEIQRRRHEERAIYGMNEGVDSEGGALVDVDIAEGIWEIQHETGKLAKLCWNKPVGPTANRTMIRRVVESSRADGSRKGGVVVYRTEEGGTTTISKPAFGAVEMKLHKMVGWTAVTEEEFEDVPGLGATLERMFGEEFGFKEDDEIINGTGVGEIQGILSAPSTVEIDAETDQVAATLLAENVISMYSRMYPGGMPSGYWLAGQTILPSLMKMYISVGASGGQLVYMPPNGLVDAPYGTLLGRPIIFCEQLPALGTVGDLTYWDPSQTVIARKGGIKSAASMHIYFDSGQTAFRMVQRVNGLPMWASTLTLKDGSTTVGPAVTVATRS